MSLIPFNKPYMTGKELWYIAQAHAKGHLAGDGSFTKLCNQWIEHRTGSAKALIQRLSRLKRSQRPSAAPSVGPGTDALNATGTYGKARELMEYLERRKKLERLYAKVKAERPFLDLE